LGKGRKTENAVGRGGRLPHLQPGRGGAAGLLGKVEGVECHARGC